MEGSTVSFVLMVATFAVVGFVIWKRKDRKTGGKFDRGNGSNDQMK